MKFTSPEQAIKHLQGKFDNLNVDHWNDALDIAIKSAEKVCSKYGIDPQRMIFFPG